MNWYMFQWEPLSIRLKLVVLNSTVSDPANTNIVTLFHFVLTGKHLFPVSCLLKGENTVSGRMDIRSVSYY